jgi:hypothetical protein
MRSHASAAHPDQVDLTGLQLANWLETCIRRVITLPQDPITANTGRLPHCAAGLEPAVPGAERIPGFLADEIPEFEP